MKNSIYSRITAVLVTVIMLLSALSLAVSADAGCFHFTEKKIVNTDTGFTIANVCQTCGEIVSDVGYVKNDSAVTLYKDTARSTEYTANELAEGFASTNGKELYTADGVITKTGKPYWLSFDLKVNSLPTLKDGDLSDTDSRAYKGCSLICEVSNGSYISTLRVIYDGWEAESGASETNGAVPDGKAPLKLFANDNGFRNAKTVVELSAGDELHFDMRIDPSTGAYDVYIDRVYVTSGKRSLLSDDKTPHIRLWEGEGKNHGGNFDFTNIEVFYDNYTESVHLHEYYEIIEFDDEGVAKYQTCDCGIKLALDCPSISSVITDGIPHIYDGFGEIAANAKDYWFVTDLNLRGEVKNGSLLKFGDTTILEAKDGKLISGDSVFGTISYPTSYQVAVEIENGTYKLYINGRFALKGTHTSADSIVCGDISLGHHVRFLYNKAVTLGETATPAVPTYTADDSATFCCHSDENVLPKNSFVRHTENGVKYVYTCTLCGERVYSMLLKNLTNPANDTAYKYKTGALMLAELESFSANKPRYLYLADNVISKNANPYWITFDVTPTSIPSNETGNLGDPNSRVYKGYSLVSSEPAFIPISELRVIPDGWEDGNASGTKKGVTDGKAEVKIIKPSDESHIGMNSIEYRFTETVAYLEVGKTTSFALRIDPKTGVYDVYVDGIYKASSVKESYTDMTPKIAFHDNGAGEFTYSNVRICDEAQNLGEKIVVIELTAKFEANESASENAYTALLAIERNGEKYNLFYANNKNGTLAFKDSNGTLNTLYDADGNIILLNNSQQLAVVYDDINGDVRYFANGRLTRYMNEEALIYANDIKIYDADFANGDGSGDSLRFDPTKVTDVKITGVGKTDTAEIVGFQSHEIENSIRLLSGLDSPYYGSVGYDVQAYKANGEKYKDNAITKTTDTIYSSIKADGITIPASQYGYNYFSALSIEGDFLGYKGSYIIVTPFTVIGHEKYYGKEIRLNILDNGRYEYADEQ